jgi:hypothetical protein
MLIDGSLEAGTPSAAIMNVTDSQLILRQTGPNNSSNVLELDDADLTITGGNAVFDIANNTGDPTGFGSIVDTSNTMIKVLNTASDTSLSQPSYDGLPLNGSLNVAANRGIVFDGYNLASTEPVEPVEPEVEIEFDEEQNEQIKDAVADIINETNEDTAQAVTNDIQEETVGAIESSPNVNFALNATYGNCQDSNKDDPRCKMKDEMSRFLGQFLMGGSMIKEK